MSPETVSKIEEAALKDAVEDNDRRGYVKGHCGATKDGYIRGAHFGYSLAVAEYDAGERARFIQAQANLIPSLQAELKEKGDKCENLEFVLKVAEDMSAELDKYWNGNKSEEQIKAICKSQEALQFIIKMIERKNT